MPTAIVITPCVPGAGVVKGSDHAEQKQRLRIRGQKKKGRGEKGHIYNTTPRQRRAPLPLNQSIQIGKQGNAGQIGDNQASQEKGSLTSPQQMAGQPHQPGIQWWRKDPRVVQAVPLAGDQHIPERIPSLPHPQEQVAPHPRDWRQA